MIILRRAYGDRRRQVGGWPTRAVFAAASLALLASAYVPALAAPKKAQVEAFAKLAAETANRDLARNAPSDGVTRSQRAYASGTQVIYEFVLAIRQDAGEQAMAAWRASVRSEIYPAACKEMKENEFFESGLSFRYRYLDLSRAVLDDFTVNKFSCKGL